MDNSAGYNSAPFIQDNLWTDGSVQYLVYAGEGRKPMITWRDLPAGEFAAPFDMSTIPGQPFGAETALDEHNVYAVAVDSAGFIHVAGNMHGNNGVRYARSTVAGAVETITARTMTGAVVKATYPAFVKLPDGTLLFFHRDGSPQSASLVVNRYDVVTQTWTRLATVIDGNPTGMGPYAHHIAVDDAGVIHVAWEWRTPPAGCACHQDPSYARSTDGGVTWQRSDGTPYTLPITHTTAEKIELVPQGSGLSNAGGLEVDPAGRPHYVYRRNNAAGSKRIYHAYRDAALGWIVRELPATTENAARPGVFSTDSGRTYVLLRTNTGPAYGALKLIDVTPSSSDFYEFPILDIDLRGYSPTFDTRALVERNELHLLASPTQITVPATAPNLENWQRQWGAVYSVDLSQIDKFQQRGVVLPTIERVANMTAPATPIDVTATDLTALPLDQLRMPNPPHRDRPVFVRFAIRGRVTAGSMNVRAAEAVDGGAVAHVGRLEFVETADTTKYTPWVPLDLLPVSTTTGAVSLHAQVTGGTGTIVSASLELGALADY